MRRIALLGAALAATAALKRASAPAATAASAEFSPPPRRSEASRSNVSTYRDRPQLVVDRPSVATDGETGDDEVPLELQVVSQETGAAIAGANATLNGLFLGATDASGKLQVAMAGAAGLHWRAEGFAPRTAWIETPGAGISRVGLEPLIDVEIINRTEAREEWSPIIERIDGDTYLSNFETLDDRHATKATPGTYALGIQNENGELVAFRVARIDRTNSTVVLRGSSPTHFAVRVRDRNGRPVANAGVSARLVDVAPQMPWWSGSTTEDGSVMAPLPEDHEIDLEVSIAGMTAASRRIVPRHRGQSIELVLDGLFECKLRDPRGNSVPISGFSMFVTDSRKERGSGRGFGGMSSHAVDMKKRFRWPDHPATVNISLSGDLISGEASFDARPDPCIIDGHPTPP